MKQSIGLIRFKYFSIPIKLNPDKFSDEDENLNSFADDLNALIKKHEAIERGCYYRWELEE